MSLNTKDNEVDLARIKTAADVDDHLITPAKAMSMEDSLERIAIALERIADKIDPPVLSSEYEDGKLPDLGPICQNCGTPMVAHHLAGFNSCPFKNPSRLEPPMPTNQP